MYYLYMYHLIASGGSADAEEELQDWLCYMMVGVQLSEFV